MILLMGLPGSGKGTQGKMLADEYGLHLISMGDLVRMYVTGERRRQMMAGVLLDDTEIISMVDRVLSHFNDGADCVLDGFPRTVAQSKWLMQQVNSGRFSLSAMVYLVASQATVKDRLKARGRLDDREDVIDARFKQYEQLTQPVVDWFDQQGEVPILRIDAERPADTVNQEITKQLKLS